MSAPLARIVYLEDTTPPGETQLDFWRRKAREWAQDKRELRAELEHQRDLLEAAYDLVAHYRFPAAPCREDAVAEVVERFEELLTERDEDAATP